MAKNTSKIILNKEQLEAIKHGEGPLLIIAGAGTGKTTVVTERIKYLITQENISPSNILALTFTEKAAREMEARVDEALPLGYANMWLSTFHAFGDRILRDEALSIGLDPHYKLMTEAESVQLLRQNLFKLDLDYYRPLGNPTKFLDGILQHFSRLKDEDVWPNDYTHWAKAKSEERITKSGREEIKKYQELTGAYKTYEELKIKEGLMDFADLIANVLRLFRDRPNILKKYQEQFKYVLVDEFQDTNYAQYVLIKLLSPPPKSNLTVVGDDNQCLPSDTKISLFEGEKRIDRVKIGDTILTAVGKGHTSCLKVTKVFKNRKKTKLITFTLETGEKITVTDNHKMFCYIPSVEKNKQFHFVYLMKDRKYGWRMGVTNDIAARLRLEAHADGIITIGAYKTDQEARFYEALYSAKYGIPTVPFSPRQKQAITGKWLKKLFNELDTENGAEKLAADFGLDLNTFCVVRGGVVCGQSERVRVNFQMCYRNHRSKGHKQGFVGNPAVGHIVYLETSSEEAIGKLVKAGFKLTNAKKGKRFRFSTTDIGQAWLIADRLVEITGGILDKKFAIGTENYQHKTAVIVPAGNVFPGNYLPVLKGKTIIYRKIVEKTEKTKNLVVYDLEVEKTHNFVANGVVVHNSIYKFRGAAVSNILHFVKDYPKAKSVVLNKNYRSTQTILDHAYRLIKNNDPDTLEAAMGISKKLTKERHVEEEPIEFLFAERVEDEADLVAGKICELSGNGLQTTDYGTRTAVDSRPKTVDYLYSDFAILVRANKHSEPFVRALSRLGLPYQFLGPGILLKQPEVKDLIAYLKVLYNFEDSVAMYRVLSMDFFDISGRDLAALNNYAKKNNLSLFEAGEKIKEVSISEKTKGVVGKLTEIIHRHLNFLKKETAGQILYYFLEETGLLKQLTDFKTVSDERKAQNVAKFFDKLKVYEVDHEDASVFAVVDFLNLSMELGESPLATDIDWTENNAVNILTVHSAKGLEFPVVFLVNLADRRFPTSERKEQIPIPDELIKEILPKGDYHLEEERRLFYVGMTRAMNRLYLTAANYYGEGKREKKTSSFVTEALGPDATRNTQDARRNQMSIFDFKPTKETVNGLRSTDYSKVNYLSYSQVDTFSTCPLQYKYRYVLRIPTPPNAAASFGSTIHQTMRDFYQRVMARQKPQKDDLLKILAENWSFLGYPSKAHEEKYKKEGEKILSEYFDKSFDRKSIPLALEQVFSVKLGPNLKVGGKIDRIDRVERDKSEYGIEIIDYKTGKSTTRRDVEKDLQLTLYALAAADGTLTYMGLLKQTPKPEEVTVSFYFFDNQEKISSTRKAIDFKNLKVELLSKAEEISKSDFPPLPGKHCDFCEFRLLCEAWS